MNIFLTQFWTVKLLIHNPQPHPKLTDMTDANDMSEMTEMTKVTNTVLATIALYELL